MKVQGRRKRGIPISWLDKVKADIKAKRLSADEVYDRASTWIRGYVIVHTPHIKVGIR